jgi:hypothetical protein
MGILIGVGFIAAVVVATLNQMRVTCEVCMEYHGRQACEEAVAVDRSEALMQATTSACAQLSGGVTEGIRCNNLQPLSTNCSD